MAGMQEGAPVAPEMAAAQEGGGGDDAKQVILDVSTSIDGIAKALESINPEAAKAMAALNQQFQQIISSVSQGGAEAQGPAAGSPEAAGARGAMPAGPQGAVR